MIDVESEIFTEIATALRSEYPNITVYGEMVLSPSSFPCVCVEEADNFSYLPSRDSGSNENHASVMYEVNVYSNKSSGKKTECKNIFATIDREFTRLGFTRNMKSPFNMNDGTKYRIIGRYSAIVSADNMIYRR